jgi:hypothetical protein
MQDDCRNVANPAVSRVLPLCCSDKRRAEVTAPAPI